MSLDLDMAEIAKVFFQECREGLDVMEAGLLSLDAGANLENINTIFRAAHSIKGGAATFGFSAVAQFTHGVETLLDEMRNAARPVTDDAIQVLLKSCDCLRDMMQATEAERALDQAKISGVNLELNRILADASGPAALATPVPLAPAPAAAPAPAIIGWAIRFEPVVDLLRLRNEPTRMFAELQRLGEFRAQADITRLPSIEEMDSESCYLSWDIEVDGDITRQQLDEVFDWVDSRCKLRFTPRLAAAVAVAAPAPEPAAAAIVPKPAAAGAAAPKAGADAGSIRVATEKLDAIINLVGELLITQSMLSGFADGIKPHELSRLRQGLTQLSRNTRELQESVMQIRMLPIGFAFNRFPRLVHDLSRKLGKKVELKLQGESTELDKTVLEKIGDPLVHLVRNALDHGLETPQLRLAAGKSDTGTLELGAFHESGNIIIEVRDDGAGLNKTRILQKARERGLITSDQDLTDEQIDNLIFMPGFSTAEQVSDVSGRGVGMDVVRRNINDLGGHVQIYSKEGAGSTIRIRLPLTLAILDGQLVRVGKETFIISLLSILETIQIDPTRISKLAGLTSLYRLRDEYLPIVKLCDQFGLEPDNRDSEDGLLVIVEADGKRVGLLVDDLLAQQQVVIKSLEANYNAVSAIAGATILGDGAVALIIDVPDLIRSATERKGHEATAHAA
ncbi:MAG: two-component system, chemotaxis family, sensor kinase CheA [Gammaproteobacteria bacterium]|jgi:two-component system chemotaxis sensor kinase CheA|nr:two-component system, chemotaxis family, sensor kinase CheA [Gammaproteobacteria bacterium]